MRSRIAVVFCSLLISGSAFFSFTALPPAGSPQTPIARFLDYFAGAGWTLEAAQALPGVAQSFGLSFLVPLPLMVLGIFGLAPRFLALAASFLTIGTFLYAWFGGRALIESYGVTLPSGAAVEALSRLTHQAGWGFWLWIGGGLLMLTFALLDPGNDY